MHFIILAGAPEAQHLDWSARSLTADIEAPFAQTKRRHGKGNETIAQEQADATPSHTYSRWRDGAYEQYFPVRTTNTQEAHSGTTRKRSIHKNNSKSVRNDDLGDDFLQHSLAFLHELKSSQIIPSGIDANEENTDIIEFTTLTDSFLTSTSSDSTCTNSSTTDVPQVILPHLLSSSTITNLRTIPSASHLRRLHPQTLTVDLLVTVISASPLRTVQLRRSKSTTANRRPSTMDILELTVGDETRAGFGITFWLPPPPPSSDDVQRPNKHAALPTVAAYGSNADWRKRLTALRTGDVIFCRHVALAVFRDSVHGQSLNRKLSRTRTEVVRLSAECVTRTVAAAAAGGAGAGSGNAVNLVALRDVERKFERVKRWCEEFVGRPVVGRKRDYEDDVYDDDGDEDRNAGMKRAKTGREMLPPDTQ